MLALREGMQRVRLDAFAFRAAVFFGLDELEDQRKRPHAIQRCMEGEQRNQILDEFPTRDDIFIYKQSSRVVEKQLLLSGAKKYVRRYLSLVIWQIGLEVFQQPQQEKRLHIERTCL